jgi:hypothetical protein
MLYLEQFAEKFNESEIILKIKFKIEISTAFQIEIGIF